MERSLESSISSRCSDFYRKFKASSSWITFLEGQARKTWQNGWIFLIADLRTNILGKSNFAMSSRCYFFQFRFDLIFIGREAINGGDDKRYCQRWAWLSSESSTFDFITSMNTKFLINIKTNSIFIHANFFFAFIFPSFALAFSTPV